MFLGLHLSGSNSNRTTVVCSKMQGRTLVVERVYEHIGSVDQIHSDRRLLDIISYEKPVSDIFTDVPLSLPPCSDCRLTECPGLERCDTLAVAYMSKLRDLRPGLRRRRRLFNPQSQRLWDSYAWSKGEFSGLEPGFNPSKAPLVVRARVLQKQLNWKQCRVLLKETSVPHVLYIWEKAGLLPSGTCSSYRSFSQGSEVRDTVLDILAKKKYLRFGAPEHRLKGAGSVDFFHGVLCSFIALLFKEDKLDDPPEPLFEENGWVYLPRGLP